MKKHWIEHCVKIPLYPGKIRIIFTDDIEKARSIFHGVEFYELFAHSIESHEFSDYIMIFNFNHKHKISNGTIAHEALHISYYIFERIGIKLDFDNPEVLAYLVGWITDKIHELMGKHNLSVS